MERQGTASRGKQFVLVAQAPCVTLSWAWRRLLGFLSDRNVKS